ncbi:hypothetical protein Pmani_038767 [Petrolisthes manimaculis]|uniref:Uncharacterized protein n=1 Tax=Petrolisthes manimaculis TaxID=1843537 RepID=A0AAE1NEG8_9EUCA|nr:hypothetical protein Pmani_038767 [Petrolisthes manimaculis]
MGVITPWSGLELEAGRQAGRQGLNRFQGSSKTLVRNSRSVKELLSTTVYLFAPLTTSPSRPSPLPRLALPLFSSPPPMNYPGLNLTGPQQESMFMPSRDAL